MFQIESFEAFHIVGLALRTRNAEAFETIPPHWARFHGENVLARVTNRLSDEVHAVYTEFENEDRSNEGLYTLLIGVPVASLAVVPDGLRGITVPAARRAVFPVERGRTDLVGAEWQKIWRLTELPKSYRCEHERYRANGDIDICVGLR